MTASKDGFTRFPASGDLAARPCCRSPVRQAAVLALLGAALCFAAAISDSSADPRPAEPPFAVTCVLANRAMSVADQPELRESRSASAAAANKPARRITELPANTRAFGPLAADDLKPAPSQGPILLADLAGEDNPAQPPPAQPQKGSIISSIRMGGSEAQPISIAKNSAAVIDLKAEIDRAEIVDPKVAEVTVKSPRQVAIAGKEIGNTQLVLWIGEKQQVLDISVELNLSRMQDLIKSLAPTSDVQASSVNGKIVLRGYVPDADTAERIADLAALVQGGEVKNQLMVAGVQQTMLRVVVAEVNKVALRELGVNWAIGGSDWTRDFFFANNLGQLNPTVISSSGVPNVVLKNSLGGQMTYSMAGVGNTASTNVTFGFPRAELQMFMQALRENDLSKTLAEPNLVAISGQTATFLAGGEVPIPVTQGGAVAGSITIEYKEFGVRLAFTPTVLGGQIIRIHVMSEVSEALPGTSVAGGLPVYTFTTRRVESTIECGNGQTFAIAGLLSDQVRASAAKIPGLGDVPVLGSLFSSTSYQKSQTEMVVLVTPQLVEPLEPHQVRPPPGGLMTDPNDFELFALQQLEGPSESLPEYDRVPRNTLPVNTRPGEATGWPASQLALRGPWGLADFEENR